MKTKLKSLRLIIFPDYTNVIKSFEMILVSKRRREKLEPKKQKYGNRKNQNTERLNPSFTRRIGRKYRLI